MLEGRGDMWVFGGDAYVVTTNGFVKANGAAVMGRGCAKEAAERWPKMPRQLGRYLKRYGNRPFVFKYDLVVVTFPVKPEFGKNGEPGWQAKAELPLIKESARHLVEMADKFGWERVIVPRPGCGNGGLSWKRVGPALAPILDNRFTVVTR